jgi:transcriptional regulator GlxA family with amidase domain
MIRRMTDSRVRTVGVLLFPGFELLDVFGPLEVFGNRVVTERYRTCTVAAEAGAVTSAQGARALADHGLADCPPLDLLLVPGGMGTRREVENRALLDWIAARAASTERTASVCTGAALLARAGVLDGRRATTNKLAWDWVVSQGPAVTWVRHARWVADGARWTSSGVTAGIDMALALVADTAGEETANLVTRVMEHVRHADPNDDPFT